MIRRIFLTILFALLTVPQAFADIVWINDLRNLFLTNNAIIYEINIRTFGAQDTNKDGIIDPSEGEESGNFLNAIGRLDELQGEGINTLHVLPIMAIGKTNAIGTAGSLYAPVSFNKLNPQLKSNRTMLSVEEQAIKFINEAHKRGIRIMIDLPSCGAYDLYLTNPELFVRNASGEPVMPMDWKDVRLFNAGSETAVNQDVYNLYKSFVDYVIELGADGIRADVATSKPAKFWQDLIAYSRKKDPQFLWLAEASEAWKEPIAKEAVFTPYNKLLEAGFDGFYAGYFNMKNWKSASELMNEVKFTNSIRTKFSEPKSVIGSFTTHDEISPVLINGIPYSQMILWLNATLPVNAYYVDGFPTGDNYIYFWGNKKARKTETDDNMYSVHRGQLDIFNYSRKPGGNNTEFEKEFNIANNFKRSITPIITNGKYTQLSTNNPKIFAYAMSHDKMTVLVFGNIDFRNMSEGKVHVPKYNPETIAVPINLKTYPKAIDNGFKLNLEPGEIQVFMVSNFEVK